jgi:hypothetical protein
MLLLNEKLVLSWLGNTKNICMDLKTYDESCSQAKE